MTLWEYHYHDSILVGIFIWHILILPKKPEEIKSLIWSSIIEYTKAGQIDRPLYITIMVIV